MKIALLGDIAFFGKYDITKNTFAKDYFAHVSEYLKGFDYVIGNFESPFSLDSRPYGHKSAYIRSRPENIALLSFLNIGIVNLANNHIFDYGKEGYKQTINLLNEHNINFFGIEDRVEFIDGKSTKLAFHGYCCYSTNPIGLHDGTDNGTSIGINKLDVGVVKSKMKNFYDLGYHNIISFHLGQEHVNYPNYDHLTMARQLSQVCPYVFYGHHPHVMQGIEEFNDSLIAYSLGNFCFDDVYTSKSIVPLIKQSNNNKASIILTLEFKDGCLTKYKPIGIFAGDDEIIVNHNPSVRSINEYSKSLSLDKNEYIKKRNDLLNSYLTNRKLTRDLNWYLKRCKPSSAFMLYSAFKNMHLYKKHVLNHLRD